MVARRADRFGRQDQRNAKTMGCNEDFFSALVLVLVLSRVATVLVLLLGTSANACAIIRP